MTQFTTPPAIDGFETTLAQSWNGLTGTIYVDSIPNATLSGGDKTYVVVNPGKTTQQVARISGWSVGQLTCDSITVKKGAGTNYTSVTHAVKSKVIITDVYQTWEDLETAVNSKADTNNPTFTTMITGPVYASLAVLTTAYPTPTSGQQSVFCTLEGQYYDAQGGSRQPRASGINPNASDTEAGKVEMGTPTQITAGTSIGETGARLVVGPAELKTVTDIINAQLATIPVVSFGGSSVDGAIDGTSAVTITGSNNTYIVMNYSSRSAGTAARICTVTPTGCVVHIKIKGNADFTNWTFDFNGKGAAGGAVGVAGSATTQILGPINTGGSFFGGGGASSSTNGGNGQAAGGTKGGIYSLNANILGRRLIEIACGSGGGGGNGSATGGNGGGALIIEVGGNLTVNSGSTVIRANGINGGTGAPNYGGGGGGGGTILIMYNGILTGTVTPTVAGGTGGIGGSNNGGNGGVGEFVFTKNYMF